MPGSPLCLAGLAAAVLAWVVIGASWALNSDWFVFTEHAFSDLGGPGARAPWLYNYGLITVGLVVVAFSACPYRLARDKMEVYGSALLAVAGVFLALIGVYPSGTRPHTFVSSWFFVQMDAALLALSLGAYSASRSRPALASALAAALAFPLAGAVEALAGWPSAAVLEAYGILVIDFCVAMLTLEYLAAGRRGG